MPDLRRAVCVVFSAVVLLAAPLVLFAGERKGGGVTEKPSLAANHAAHPVEKPRERAVSNEELLATIEQLKGLVTEQSRELEAQRAALLKQQQKTEEMERQFQAKMAALAAPASSASPAQEQEAAPRANSLDIVEGQLEAVADNQREISQRVSQVQADLSNTKNSVEGRIKSLGPFHFSGDARIRFEPFYGGGPSTALLPDRVRYRLRLRFNANAKFNDEFSGGFSLGSGDTNDPISTNQTLTNGFTRKPFFIDRAFVKYDPRWMRPFSVTAGKFGYTWYRTELTWDNDLNPEGFSETLAWRIKSPILERIALVGFQLPVIELSTKPDTLVFGGQLQTNWKFGDAVKFAGYVGYYNYKNADALRAARAATTVGGSSNSNAASTTGSQYESKFGLLDVIGRLDFKTPWARWPVMTQLDFVNNTRACRNLVNIPVAQQTACNPRDRSGYWAEIQFGRTQEQGDWNFGYTYIRIEREATVDAFNFSDLRQPTNVFNHRVNLNYQAYKNIQLGFTGLLGRPLVTSSSPMRETILKRLQFDVVYKF